MIDTRKLIEAKFQRHLDRSRSPMPVTGFSESVTQSAEIISDFEYRMDIRLGYLKVIKGSLVNVDGYPTRSTIEQAKKDAAAYLMRHFYGPVLEELFEIDREMWDEGLEGTKPYTRLARLRDQLTIVMQPKDN